MKNLREKSRRISGKINAFRKIISERHLIWNAVLVNFRTLCNCYIIPTNFKAYKKAQDALKNMEDMTFSDDEIDKFLPKELRRT